MADSTPRLTTWSAVSAIGATLPVLLTGGLIWWLVVGSPPLGLALYWGALSAVQGLAVRADRPTVFRWMVSGVLGGGVGGVIAAGVGGYLGNLLYPPPRNDFEAWVVMLLPMSLGIVAAAAVTTALLRSLALPQAALHPKPTVAMLSAALGLLAALVTAWLVGLLGTAVWVFFIQVGIAALIGGAVYGAAGRWSLQSPVGI